MSSVESINQIIAADIKNGVLDANGISDTYHTFGELYTHRITLFIALCKMMSYTAVPVWRSKIHSDGTFLEGWFLLGIHKEDGKQITYHLPQEYYWDQCGFAEELTAAPFFDGHTSEDVLKRITAL